MLLAFMLFPEPGVPPCGIHKGCPQSHQASFYTTSAMKRMHLSALYHTLVVFYSTHCREAATRAL